MLRKYIKHISIITVLIAFSWFIFELNATAKDASKQAQQNSKTIYELAKLANRVNDNLDLLMKLGAISKQTYEDLRMLPTKPMDSLGNNNPEWYLVGEFEIYLIKIPDSCGATILKIPFRGE